MNKLNEYIKPTSVTWWCGVFMLLVGSLGAERVDFPGLSAVTEILGALAGDASPALLIGNGLAFIGVRAKMDRK